MVVCAALSVWRAGAAAPSAPPCSPLIVGVSPASVILQVPSDFNVTLAAGCTPAELAGVCGGVNASCSCLLTFACGGGVAAGGVLTVRNATGPAGGPVVRCTFPPVDALPDGCATARAPAVAVIVTLDGSAFSPGVLLQLMAPCGCEWRRERFGECIFVLRAWPRCVSAFVYVRVRGRAHVASVSLCVYLRVRVCMCVCV